MRDQDRRALPGRGEEAVEDLRFPAHVELRRRLVEQHHSRPHGHGGQGARKGDALPLPAGQVGAVVVGAGQDRVQPGQAGRARRLEGLADDVIGRPRRGHVVAQGQLQAHEVLEDGGDTLPPRGEVDLAQVHAVDLDRPRLRVVQPAQQLRERRLAGAVLSHDGEGRARRDREVEVLEHGRGGPALRSCARRIGERDVAETDLAGGPLRRPLAGGESAGRAHRRLQTQDGGHRSGRPVQGPAESAERDRRHTDRALHVDDRFPERDASGRGRLREHPEDEHVRGHDEQHAPHDRTLAQAGGRVLQIVQARAAFAETLDRPGREAEQAQLLARRRVHGQAVGVLGIPLRASHLVRVAVAPDRALAQQPVRGQPRARQHDRRPPRVADEDHGGGEPPDHGRHAVRDEVHGDRERGPGHAQVEVARDGEVAREGRILEMSHAGRAHAGLGEPVVEPGRGAVAEVRAHRLVDRAEHLEQDEHRPCEGERPPQRIATLHGADEHAHRDREGRGQDPSQQEGGPPGDGEGGVRLRQDGEEFPFVALGQPRGPHLDGRV